MLVTGNRASGELHERRVELHRSREEAFRRVMGREDFGEIPRCDEHV